MRTISLLLAFLLVCRPVAATAACSDLAIGVNETTISWQSDQQWPLTIDQIAAGGVRYLRVGMHWPLDRLARIVRYANDRNIRVLISIPLGLEQFYPGNSRPRPGNRIFRSVRPLAEIDLNSFAAAWREHRKLIRDSGARVFAYEIGNEINNPDFNGDLPIESTGRIVSVATCGESCASFARGLGKFVNLLRFVRGNGGLTGEQVIAGGFSDPLPSAWHVRAGGVWVQPRDVIERLQRLGVGNIVDGYAIHSYARPDVPPSRSIVSAMSACLLGGSTGKPCWITEWGVRSDSPTCSVEPPRNLTIISFVRAMRAWADRGLAGAFYFDWDKNPRLSIFRCGHMVADASAVVTSAFCSR